MKKLFILLICSAFLFSGCTAGDKNAEIKSGQDVLVTIGDSKITKSSVYNVMLGQSGMNTILRDAEKYILDKEIELTDEMEAEAKESLENLSTMYGDYFSQMVNYYGYENEDDFYENGLLLDVRLSHLVSKYIEMNFEEYKTTYSPKKVNVLIFGGIEDASNAYAAVESGSTFQEVAEEFNATSSYFDRVITSSNTFFDSNVLAYVNSVEEPAYSGTILSSKDASCFLIQVVSVDPSEYQEEAIEAISNDVSSIFNDTLAYYLDQYDFTIYDKGIYDSFEKNVPDFLVQSK